MPIPESDHQMMANLIAFASLIIAAVVIIYSLMEIRNAKQIAMQANRIANKANQLMEEALQSLKPEQKIKKLPDVSLRSQVSKISRISSEFDIITLNFTNESPHKIILESIHILPPFRGQMDSPFSASLQGGNKNQNSH